MRKVRVYLPVYITWNAVLTVMRTHSCLYKRHSIVREKNNITNRFSFIFTEIEQFNEVTNDRLDTDKRHETQNRPRLFNIRSTVSFRKKYKISIRTHLTCKARGRCNCLAIHDRKINKWKKKLFHVTAVFHFRLTAAASVRNTFKAVAWKTARALLSKLSHGLIF